MKWTKTTQKSVPLLSRYIATKFSISDYISKSCLHNLVFKRYKYINSKEEVQAFFSVDELEDFYKILWKSANEDKKLKIFLNEYKQAGNKLVKLSLEIKNKKLKNHSNEELIKLFKLFVEKYTYFISLIYNGNFLVNVYTKKLLQNLGKLKEDEEFRILVKIPKDTTVQKMQKDISGLHKFMKEKKLLFKDFDDLDESAKRKVSRIYNKYVFMGSVFLTTNKYPTIKSFFEEIKNFSDPPKTAKNLISTKSSIIKKLKISRGDLDIINEFISLSFYRTEMLFFIQKSEYNALNLFEEIASRLKIKYSELVYMTYEEILESLSRNKLIVAINKIHKRFDNYAVVLKDGSVKLLNAKIRKSHVAESLTIIKGSVGSHGKVVGKVRIIRNSSEINKIKNGEILVTYMTTPDFIIGINKAVAIVTNDGGITCHAAIIARELNIPCIIGTKIATRVLKDGDLVEVNADSGIVKIIKSKIK